MEVVLKPEDFKNVGIVATNCNREKLNTAINEALKYDFCHTFKGCDVEVRAIIKKILLYVPDTEMPIPTEYEINLVNGNIFVENNKTFENFGLKSALIRYAYSRYLLLNEFNDSAVGQKTQNFQFSVPKTFAELKTMSDKYRNMAKVDALSTYEYISNNRDQFPQFVRCLNLSECYCGNKDKQNLCDIETTGYQLKSRNIKNY